MGLLPEFFMLLGIDIFLAMSLLSALLDDDLPSPVQYLFQGAAIVGLGQLMISQGYVNSGVFGRDPTDTTRFWISTIYLASAISNVIGLNVYLAAVRRKMALASTFSGTVTVPTLMTSAFFVSSFLGSGGDISFTPATIMMLVIAAIVSGLSIFAFLRQASKHINVTTAEPTLPMTPPGTPIVSGVAASPVSGPPMMPGVVLPFQLPGRKGKKTEKKIGEDWEEAPAKEEERGR